jgi:hypothetical protein
VSVLIGQDGNARGKTLFEDLGYSIACLGACLGTISKAAVNENIGWIERFNVALQTAVLCALYLPCVPRAVSRSYLQAFCIFADNYLAAYLLFS